MFNNNGARSDLVSSLEAGVLLDDVVTRGLPVLGQMEVGPVSPA